MRLENSTWARVLALGMVGMIAPSLACGAGGPTAPMPRVVLDVNGHLERHWRDSKVQPAAEASEAELFRRLMLDLTGRVPTTREVETFLPNGYLANVRRLVADPEFEWYFATVLDEIIQSRHAGNTAFVAYLRKALNDNKGWDTIFREVMVGPWDSDAQKPAMMFLDRRAKDLDVLTVDVTRSFFGVDISCARCHNHPLVRDWKRDHYYGMAAFMVRTVGGKGRLTEKNEGEAKYAGRDGKERVVPMMFLTGRVLENPAKPPSNSKTSPSSRRETLVAIALEERKFFARSFVNRIWEYLLGQGLVNPVDQMHSGNPALIAELLDALAEDFASHGYDVRRLVSEIVLSRAYRLDSRSSAAMGDVDARHFAVSRLRPLSARQLARSLVVSTGDGSFDGSLDRLAALDKQSSELLNSLDPRTADFQSSTREALFVSNGESVRKLIAADGKNLTAKLASTKDDITLVKTAVSAVYSRPATEFEVTRLTDWLRKQSDRQSACEDLVWALVASGEFRFNH